MANIITRVATFISQTAELAVITFSITALLQGGLLAVSVVNNGLQQASALD
jgi:hypothetical protein